MNHALKKWWLARHTKHYLNNHWHLMADIFLLVIILSLGVALIILRFYPTPKVNLNPINHVVKDVAISATSSSLLVNVVTPKININSGQSFLIKVTLENNGKNDISALELNPNFLSGSFSIYKLENINASSSLKVKGRKLILETLKAGETEDADVLVTINAKKDSPRKIDWLLSATYHEGGEAYKKNYDLESLKLITNLKIEAAAYYNSPLGDQLGSGPIPPIIGFPTNYWIFFEINNEGNDLSNLAISAKLPEGVTLSNHKTLSSGVFNYNESQKRLTWTVKEVSVKNGLYQVGFEVELLPLAKQTNTNPLLVSSISYLATDVYTGEKLSGKLLNIDTQLPLDTINGGQGVVAK